jgi:molybdate transport system ATP-binding protein
MIDMNVSKKLLTSEGLKTLTVNLHLNKMDFCAFFGQSGAGKTTTLRMLAGLLKPDSGTISVNDCTWFDSESNINLPTRKRNIGFVFQDYALFPTMTVKKNIEYAIGKGHQKVDSIIELMGLDTFANTYPDQLSGGQRQRVALARTLVRSPEILLLDEPLSALDSEMRTTLQDELCKIHDHFELTSIIVTHDISEIYRIARSVAVFKDHRISNYGSPEKIFGHNLSTKFRVVGTIIDIKNSKIASVVTIQVGGNQTKVVIDIDEAEKYSVGQSVIVAAKAFTPVLLPLTRT